MKKYSSLCIGFMVIIVTAWSMGIGSLFAVSGMNREDARPEHSVGQAVSLAGQAVSCSGQVEPLDSQVEPLVGHEEPLASQSLDSEDIQSRIDSYIEEHAEETASVSLAIFDEKSTRYKKQVGYMDDESKVLADSDSVYEWGSVSKLLTWVSVMQLVEDGQLDLEEDISTYLDKEMLKNRRYEEKLSMLHLMNHNAGFQEVLFPIETTDTEKILSLRDALITYAPSQTRKPGEVCSYSNYGAALAAYIVEAVSGMSFQKYVQENIFEPLEMQHTSMAPDFSDNSFVLEKRGENRSYAFYNGEKINLEDAISYVLLYPAGSACGTFDDFIRFAKAIAPQQENTKLFEKQETLEQFYQASLFYTGTEIIRNSHGMWTLPYGNTLIGHSGNTNGYSSGIYFDAVTGEGYAVMTNVAGESTYNFSIMGEVFGPWKAPTQEVKESLHDIRGVYLSSRQTFSGFAKTSPYHSMFLMLQETENPNTYNFALVPGMELERVQGDTFVSTSPNGTRTLKQLTQTNGNLVFEGYTQDEYKIDTWKFYLALASLLLFVVIMVISFVRLIVCFVRFLIHSIRKKNPANAKGVVQANSTAKTASTDKAASTTKAKGKIYSTDKAIALAKTGSKAKTRTGCTWKIVVSSLINIIVGVLVFILILSDMQLSKGSSQLLLVINFALMVLAGGIFVHSILKDKKKDYLLLIQLCVFLGNCLYWEWFNFWLQ